jgi:hypothetical protein
MPSSAVSRATVLSVGTCVDLVRSRRRGRIVLGTGRHPRQVPVNYVLDGDTVVFCTAGGTNAGRARGQIALVVDGCDLDRGDRWTVVLRGRCEEISIYEMLGDEALLPVPPNPVPKVRFERLLPTEIAGRRFHDTRIHLQTGGSACVRAAARKANGPRIRPACDVDRIGAAVRSNSPRT